MHLGALYCLLLVGTVAVFCKENQGHISVVLVGATGDLAKKYLWQGLFQLYINEVDRGHTFSFHGAALTPPEKAETVLFDALKSLSCPTDVNPNRCALVKEQFIKLTSYRQLKTAENYTALHQHILTSLAEEDLHETGRLFYLSVPPFAYADIAQNINASCRPPPGAWLRVVLEKPFGHDYESAKKLANVMQTYFREKEIYRVDHYLGKQTVEQILPFRRRHQKLLDPIWNRHHVEKVEIVMKETVDAKGRTIFYDEYGVIRDVIQNHLTEILTYVAMEVPRNLTNSDDILRAKLELLGSLQSPEHNSAVIGQYQNYLTQVREEMENSQKYFTKTPTFAGVLVYIDNARWEGVPFLLVSGKDLDERTSYVRVVFKDNSFCIQKESKDETVKSSCRPKQIIFHIGNGALNVPAVLVTRSLFKPNFPSSLWKEASEVPDISVFGQPISDYHVYCPSEERDAYTALISNIYRGRKGSFVTTKNLLASWKFWSRLLENLGNETPRIYPGGAETGALLDFVIEQMGLRFVTNENLEILGMDQKTNAFASAQTLFLGNTMVSDWAEPLIQKLAEDIQTAAEESVKSKGTFHLALSGGSSPIALFQRLSKHHYGFPWKHTHLWMVDERCVPFTDTDSNFGNLERHLLQHVRIPYVNLHPMPVDRKRRLCAEEDKGTEDYALEISALVSNSSFDLVLLGLGNDGHTASIFPGFKDGITGDKLVVLSESPLKPKHRMSLTLPLINKAKRVSVLVLGKGKHDIITLISRAKSKPEKWPIYGVKPTSGQLVWYIDYDSMFR